jgi:hypothetical protein
VELYEQIRREYEQGVGTIPEAARAGSGFGGAGEGGGCRSGFQVRSRRLQPKVSANNLRLPGRAWICWRGELSHSFIVLSVRPAWSGSGAFVFSASFS